MDTILLGIDGGGSNTKLLVADKNLNRIATSIGGASNFLKIGFQEAVLNVSNLVEPIIKKYSEYKKILVIGTAGAGRPNDAQEFERYLTESLTDLDKIKVVSDAEITLKGAFENKDGAILIAGTGSILYYKVNKHVNRVGGVGKFIGDEGSAYMVGKSGLNFVSKMFDGRIPETILLKEAKTELKIETQTDLINKINKENYNISDFAKVVLLSALKSDKYSLNIIDEQTDELLLHIKVMLEKTGITNIELVLSGGLLTNENLYKNILVDKINSRFEQILITQPLHSPEYGAVSIGQELISEYE